MKAARKKSITGWVFVSPEGNVELTYFWVGRWWYGKGEKLTRREFHERYRRQHSMVRATLTLGDRVIPPPGRKAARPRPEVRLRRKVRTARSIRYGVVGREHYVKGTTFSLEEAALTITAPPLVADGAVVVDWNKLNRILRSAKKTKKVKSYYEAALLAKVDVSRQIAQLAERSS